MRLHIVAAFDDDMNMGLDGKLPWKLKDDIKHLKKITYNNIIVMGKKTYDSIGKPFKNRINVVFTSDKNIQSNEKIGLYFVTNIHEYYMLLPKIKANRNIYVIGGRQIYKMFLPYADELIFTHVKGQFNGDIKFPGIDFNRWTPYHQIKNRDFVIKYYKKSY